MKNVPFFNYPHLFKSHEDDFVRIFKDVGYRGAYILQKDLIDFEKNLAKFAGTKYAIGLANGTDAIWIALMAAGIGKGDEVIFASHTYIATAASIHFVTLEREKLVYHHHHHNYCRRYLQCRSTARAQRMVATTR
mgnify:CR=1 FL=1